MIRSNSIKTVRVSNGKPMAIYRTPFYGYATRRAVHALARAMLYALALTGAVSIVGVCAYYAGYYNLFGSLT